MTTTPPILLAVQEPPTPLHGSRIDLRHSSPPVRRSPRFASSLNLNQNHHRTPSPGAGVATGRSPRSLASATPRQKQKQLRVRGGSPAYSPPSSPISPPRMQRTKARGAGSQRLEPPPPPPSTTSMLPTPVKTPRKKEVKQTAKPAARVLFPRRPDSIDEVMPTPRKRARQGLSLESFTENNSGAGAEIQIYTDSKDKVPEVDEHPDNPFYKKKGASSRQKKKKEAPDHHPDVQELLERDEGMVYVFRGRKIYRKFNESDIDVDEDPDKLEHAMRSMPIHDLESPKRFTRSSVKPKFLFGKANSSNTAAEQAGTTSDEEAITDIEEPAVIPAQTPSKPRAGAAPATPPSTAHRGKRVTFYAQSDDAADDDEDGDAGADADDPRFTVKKARKASPFDGWQRTKTGSSSSGASVAGRGKKRAANELGLERDDGKRVKSREAV